EEFRSHGGTVANFGGPLLLLHTVGARTNREHVTPVMYRKVEGGYAVFASAAGGPRNPAWYHNPVANPEVQAGIGTQTLQFRARVAGDDERRPIWAAQKAEFPGFQDYEDKTTRQIPVVILESAS